MRTLHAEWTKFRTVRGWALGTVGAVLAAVLFLLVGTTSTNQHAPGAVAALPVGPGGEAVNDDFSFVHRTLNGDGSLTVPVTALTGVLSEPDAGPGLNAAGVTPWSKAGIIVKSSLTQGSSYAAVLTTGAHGVRMQYDYVNDSAGLAGSPSVAQPQWLRLVRSGATVTGYDSADGVHWAAIGRMSLPGGGTVEAGLFVTAPAAVRPVGGGGSSPATATGTFGRSVLTGSWSGEWVYTQVGSLAGTSGSYVPGTAGGYRASGDGFTITGAGDIAPVVGGPASGPMYAVETSLIGTFAALIVLGVVAAQFATAEYRRGLLGVTLAATPRRGRVLTAKAAVVGAVGLVVGAGTAALSLPLGEARARATHFTVLTVPAVEQLRIVLGTGLLLAATAALALSLGVLLRRSATAITGVVAIMVLPYLLAVAGLLPTGPAQWLLRLTPAAGFAIQQTLPQYPQVLSAYTPATGYFPLPPWGGFAVLGGWALLALAAAFLALGRRDA